MASADLLSVLLFNVSGKKTITGTTEDQCIGISRVIERTKDEPNLFVFVQDGLNRSKIKALQRSLANPPVADNEEADILEDLRQGPSLKTCLKTGPVVQSKPSSFIFFERLTARTTILNCRKILLVSWHGPYTGSTRDQKLGIFRALIKHVVKAQKTLGADIVILGGDFNMPLKEAAEGDQTSKVWITQTLKGRFVPNPLDKTINNTKDFLVVWPQDPVEIVDDYPKILEFESIENFFTDYPLRQKLELITQEGRRMLQGPFDHPRLLYRLRIIESATSSDIKHLRADVLQLTEQMTALNAKMDVLMQLRNPSGQD